MTICLLLGFCAVVLIFIVLYVFQTKRESEREPEQTSNPMPHEEDYVSKKYFKILKGANLDTNKMKSLKDKSILYEALGDAGVFNPGDRIDIIAAVGID